MKIKHVRITRITRYTFMSLLATAMVIYNIRFLEFLIARAWYNWITSYSTHVVEVSVIQTNIAQDLADSQIFDLNAGAPKGYLGYAYFRPLCTIIMLVNVLSSLSLHLLSISILLKKTVIKINASKSAQSSIQSSP